MERSQTFEKDLIRHRGSKDVKRDQKVVLVGTGIHKRLVAKTNRWHVRRVGIQEKALLAHFKSSNIVPEHYKLVKVGFDPKTGIQEYFQRPTLNTLERFFNFKHGKKNHHRNTEQTRFYLFSCLCFVCGYCCWPYRLLFPI